MGSASSRKVLCSSGEPPESPKRSIRPIRSFFEIDRLVCDELRQDAQHIVHSSRKVCDSVPVVQKPPESIQQKNVRPVLSVPPN